MVRLAFINDSFVKHLDQFAQQQLALPTYLPTYLPTFLPSYPTTMVLITFLAHLVKTPGGEPPCTAR